MLFSCYSFEWWSIILFKYLRNIFIYTYSAYKNYGYNELVLVLYNLIVFVWPYLGAVKKPQYSTLGVFFGTELDLVSTFKSKVKYLLYVLNKNILEKLKKLLYKTSFYQNTVFF